MGELETQVAKIQIGNIKQATTHVFLMSEPAPLSGAELFLVTELPMLNPAASSDCEQIAQAVSATLKRSYRKPVTDGTFETALAQINEELGKLASMGKTHWIGKLNGVVAVKHGYSLSIATTGKTSALLFRDGQFANISDNSKSTHPLKTFENFSVGKLKLNDILILSTTQLLNHISIDRLKNILESNILPLSAQQIIKILEDNAGPEIAFGTLVVQMVEKGIAEEEDQVDLQGFLEQADQIPMAEKAKAMAKTALAKTGPLLTKAGTVIRAQTAKLIGKAKSGSLMPSTSSVTMTMQSGMTKARGVLDPKRLEGYSKQKKFFFISAAVLLIALIINIVYSTRHKDNVAQQNAFDTDRGELERLLSDADGALLYRDDAKSKDLINTFNSRIATYTQLNAEQQIKKQELVTKADELGNRLEHTTTPQIATVATLANADNLMALTEFIGTQSGDTIVSYNKTTGATQDTAIRANETIIESIQLPTIVAGYNGDALVMWNPKSGKVDRYFSQNVPNRASFTGLAYYPTNSRVYTINKSTSQVISFATSDRGFTSPVVSVNNIPNAAGASDIAIDSNIYIYLNGEIVKYTSGKPAEFSQPTLLTPLGSKGKIYTEGGWNGLYILDIEHNRIVILNKQGEVISSLESDQFRNIKDFSVDEKGKTIYVLADSVLLKVNF